MPSRFPHGPLGAIRVGFTERSSGRLTVSAARTNVALFIHRAVRPSGILSAAT
jgi:hypothetical protein